MLEVRDCRNSGLWIQINFCSNPDGPAMISLLTECIQKVSKDREIECYPSPQPL